MLKMLKLNFSKTFKIMMANSKQYNFLLNNNNPIKNYSYTSTKPITKEFNKKNSYILNKNTYSKSNKKFPSQDPSSSILSSESSLNIFQYKNHKDLKKIYHQNQMYNYTGPQINKIVDILDYYVTLNQKNTIKSSEDILSSDSFCSELIKHIQKFTGSLDNKSILKIFNLNCNLFTKNVASNESLNKLAFSLTKDINFDKFFKDIQKFRNVSDLFLHLNNMQNIIKSDKVGDYKISLKEPRNFLYFKTNMFSKCVLNKIDLQKYPTLTLSSLIWVFGKNGIKQVDVYDKLIRELTNRVNFLNLKNLITMFSVIEKFNFFEYDKYTLKKFLKKFNSFGKRDLEKELKTSDVSYLISTVKFLTSYKILTTEDKIFEIDQDIIKIIDRLCLDYLNKESTLDDYNLTVILKYFFIFHKDNNVQFALDKLYDRFSHLIGNPVVNIFSLFFHLNSNQTDNKILSKQFIQIFNELFGTTDSERYKLTHREYIQTVFCLFQIDFFSTRIKINANILNNRNFITSLLNENLLNKVTEDFYETAELLEILSIMNNNDEDLFRECTSNCESEMTILLINKYGEETLIENNSIDNIANENSGEKYDQNNLENSMEDNMIIIDDYAKNNLYSLSQLMNILLIIKSLDLKIPQPFLDKLKLNLNNQESDRYKLTLQQKMMYNYLIKSFNPSNESNEYCELKKYETENNLMRHHKLTEILLERIKEIKSSLYIETNYILDKKFVFDVYIPSLKKAYLINITAGLLQLERHISFPDINKEHILYGNIKRHIKSEYDIDLILIDEELVLRNQSKDNIKILNELLESSLTVK